MIPLLLVEEEACHIYGVLSTHIGEIKNVQFISKLAKPSLIKWLCEDIGKLIIGAHTFNGYVSLLLMISNKVMPYINMLGSRVLDQVVCHLDCTFIVT
jgi:hypothetical protein